MKALRWVQNVAATVALVAALYLADGIKASWKDIVSASIMIVLAVVMLLGRAWEEERRAE